MKTCSRCEILKPLTEFYKKTALLYRSDCKNCHKELMRPRSANHYKNNKEYYVKRNRRQQQLLISYARATKTNKTCMDCKLPQPWWRLDFDHREETNKLTDISTAVRERCGIKKLQTEMDKCDLVCSNCHRDRTHFRRQRSRKESNPHP